MKEMLSMPGTMDEALVWRFVSTIVEQAQIIYTAVLSDELLSEKFDSLEQAGYGFGFIYGMAQGAAESAYAGKEIEKHTIGWNRNVILIGTYHFLLSFDGQPVAPEKASRMQAAALEWARRDQDDAPSHSLYNDGVREGRQWWDILWRTWDPPKQPVSHPWATRLNER